MLLFVYGTLKRGAFNEGLLSSSVFAGVTRTEKKFIMYRYPQSYPFVIPVAYGEHDASTIQGEVYDVTASDFIPIFRIESSAGYDLEEVLLENGAVALMFVYANLLLPGDGAEHVPSGEWVL